MATRPKLYDWTLLTILTAFWGSSYALIAVTLESYPPLTIVMVRMYIGAAIAFVWALALGRKIPNLRDADGAISRHWLFFFIMSILGNVAPFSLISWGQLEVASSLTGILIAIMPLATLAAAHILITHEKITPTRLAGYVIGFSGIIVLLGFESLAGLGGSAMLHQFAILAGALCYSANAIVVRFAPNRDPFMSSAVVSLLAALLVTPFALWLDQPWSLSPAFWPTVSLITLGVTSTGIATIIYFAIIHSAGPTFMSLTNYLAPPFAVGLGVFLLGEQPPVTAFVALVLILGGVALSQLGALKQAQKSDRKDTKQPDPSG